MTGKAARLWYLSILFDSFCSISPAGLVSPDRFGFSSSALLACLLAWASSATTGSTNNPHIRRVLFLKRRARTRRRERSSPIDLLHTRARLVYS